MSESTPINVQAFLPYAGGVGKRMSVDSTSAAIAIPGLAGGAQNAKSRVVVSNGGQSSAFVRMGDSSVVSTTDCMEILPGFAYLLSPPLTNPGGVYLAAVTEGSNATKISVLAGEGS